MKKFLMFALVLMVFSACSHATTTPAETDTMVDGDTEMTDDVMMDEAMVDDMDNKDDEMMIDDITDDTEGEMMTEYSLDMANFSFTPNMIEMKAGETITVKLVNVGGTHDFVIDELEVQSDVIKSGEETMVTITAPADSAGTEYAFYCSIGQHRANGMEGVLKIVE